MRVWIREQDEPSWESMEVVGHRGTHPPDGGAIRIDGGGMWQGTADGVVPSAVRTTATAKVVVAARRQGWSWRPW
jgi:hypothetical protein